MITITKEEFDLLKTRGKIPYLCDSCGEKGEQRRDYFKDMPDKIYCCVKCRRAGETNSEENIIKLMESRGMVFIESFYKPKHHVKYKCVCGDIKEMLLAEYRTYGGKCKNCVDKNRIITGIKVHKEKRMSLDQLREKVTNLGFELMTTKEEWEALDQIKGFIYKLKCKIGHEFTAKYISKWETSCKTCFLTSISGSNSRRYKHGRSKEHQIERYLSSSANRKWRIKIIKLFNNTCDICCANETIMHAHHLNGFHWDKENRFNVDNGVLLCPKCHWKFHGIYGNSDNTKEQYTEFKKEETEVKHYDFSDWIPQDIVTQSPALSCDK